MTMGVLFEHEEGADEFGLGDVDAKAVEVGERGGGS